MVPGGLDQQPPGVSVTRLGDRALGAAGAAGGLEPDIARDLAVAGVHGAAALIARSGDPAAIRAAAATPGGMTAAGIAALEETGFARAVRAAVTAAAARARELA